ncbi:MAG: ATP-binding cassette domain-containing protein [Betaproteobacteria bacterium]|nr:ATP-binding cassette domain-containing protein [Betaproteobacteria bacterium]
MSSSFLVATDLKYEWRNTDLFSREPNKTLWKIPRLEISKPGIVLLAGRNGSGKSTLLRCLLGLMRPTTGEVCWFGEKDNLRGKIGYIPELPVLPSRIKVGELIESLLGLKPQQLVQLESDDSYPASLRISNLLQRQAHLLSKGQQQRLILTLALRSQPAGFVLDEPFSGLDPWARTELAELLVTLSNRSHFLLISTHDAPQKLRDHVRETWIIANEQLSVHAGCSIPE